MEKLWGQPTYTRSLISVKCGVKTYEAERFSNKTARDETP
jgi:hypothetical protein